ncbi:hypothetical protein GLYMA_19G104032v4 [Glycine max]|nr:hypothetical protein GLYMA_19G104032v4 [Glycine max]KAH1077204.1 hypothetical protein GYH30_052635 [Glycine max]
MQHFRVIDDGRKSINMQHFKVIDDGRKSINMQEVSYFLSFLILQVLKDYMFVSSFTTASIFIGKFVFSSFLSFTSYLLLQVFHLFFVFNFPQFSLMDFLMFSI